MCDGVDIKRVRIVVAKTVTDSLGFKAALITADTSDGSAYNYGEARVLAWNRAPGTQIVTVSRQGMARIYAGWPLAEQDRFAVAGDAVSAAIGDVDGDGSDDLVVLSQDGLHAYALDNGTEEWSKAVSGGSDVALAQLDSDPALEIIIAGPTPGLVLDGATRATDWSYIDGFGAKLATGVFASGGATQWVGAAGWYSFTVFGANPWSPLWDYSPDLDIGAIATGDLDGSGVDSILYGDGQWGDVHVINPATHQERLSVNNGGYSVTAIAVGDVDGDGTPDIAFSSGTAGSGSVALTIADARTGASLWTYTPAPGPYQATAIGDVDGDGRNEVVAASNDGTYDTRIAVFDEISGVREWQSPGSVNSADDPFAIGVRAITLLPHPDQSGMDIVLAGDGSYYGKIIVLDGVSKSVKQQIGYYQSPLLESRSITGLAVMDYDHDGTADYVVSTQPASTGASGAKLEVISGANGDLLWESVAMGSGFSNINDVFVIPSEAPGGPSELVAVLPDSLRAYNSNTQLLDWVLAASNDGARYIDAGLNGPELMLYQHSGAISFYDAATQAYLRAFATASPLAGVTVLQGDARTLLVAADQKLSLVDGSDGSILASSKALGALAGSSGYGQSYSRPSAVPVGASAWHVALPARAALWRMRLDASDRIFDNGFESP